MDRKHSTSNGVGGRALVVGGGFTGLLAARMLSEFYNEVLVLERDVYPEDPVPRSGTPQDRHVHLLLLRGRQILEWYFPGLSEELVKHGACVVDPSCSISILNYHGWSVRYPSSLEVITFTRPLVDWCMRRRVSSHPRIRIIEGCRVVGLEVTGTRVSGVRCRTMPDHEGDLVVDATGRHSRTPEWLSEAGFGQTDETVVNPHLGYATRLLERSSHLENGAEALLILGKPPDQTRGGVLLPVEGERWVATLVGIGGDYPPTDDERFMEFARTLRSTALHETVKDEDPVTRIAGFRETSNRLRRYEKLPRWPRRYVVVGDAACALNPVYAQGMTVASLGVRALHRVLEAGWNNAANRFRRVLPGTYRMPWLMATAEDLRWPATEGYRIGRLGKLAHRYLDGIIAAATERPAVDETLARVVHMVDSPTKLLRPHVAGPALAHAIRPNEYQ